jgi:hypothetical protein
MKFTKMIIISIFVCLILSCNWDSVRYKAYYFKAFFLGEDDVIIRGAVFKDLVSKEPASISKIYARTSPNEVDG